MSVKVINAVSEAFVATVFPVNHILSSIITISASNLAQLEAMYRFVNIVTWTRIEGNDRHYYGYNGQDTAYDPFLGRLLIFIHFIEVVIRSLSVDVKMIFDGRVHLEILNAVGTVNVTIEPLCSERISTLKYLS